MSENSTYAPLSSSYLSYCHTAYECTRPLVCCAGLYNNKGSANSYGCDFEQSATCQIVAFKPKDKSWVIWFVLGFLAFFIILSATLMCIKFRLERRTQMRQQSEPTPTQDTATES